jgi:hypothetical protein
MSTNIQKNVLTSLNRFVQDFLKANEELLTLWNDKSNQTLLKKSLDGKKVKKIKDKNRPRKMGPYLCFCVEMRESVKKSLGDSAKNTEIVKELGKRWNLIKDDPAKVKKYVDQAQKSASAYETAMKTYVVPDAPVRAKRGKSSYLHFCSDNRDAVKKDMPDATNTQITTELGNRWNKLKEDATHNKEAQKTLDKYKAMAQTEKSEPKAKAEKVKSEPKAKEAKEEKVKSEPKAKVKTKTK